MHLRSTYFGGRILDGAGLIPGGGNSPSIGGWIVWPAVIQHKERNLSKYWNLAVTKQRIQITNRTKLATKR